MLLVKAQRRLDAKYISENTQVTLRFALKILRKLAVSGMIRSYKGVGGGYELNRPPEQITLYDIITLIEGNCYLSRCLDESIGCKRKASASCKVRAVFSRVSGIVGRELRAVTMDQLL